MRKTQQVSNFHVLKKNAENAKNERCTKLAGDITHKVMIKLRKKEKTCMNSDQRNRMTIFMDLKKIENLPK